MSKKLLVATASALVMMATAAHANDRHSHRDGSMNDNAAIQKGQSASVKNYGYNKQGDHYAASQRNSRFDERYNYPGQRTAFGTKGNIIVQKGGSAITDASVNASAESTGRPYGTFWR